MPTQPNICLPNGRGHEARPPGLSCLSLNLRRLELSKKLPLLQLLQLTWRSSSSSCLFGAGLRAFFPMLTQRFMKCFSRHGRRGQRSKMLDGGHKCKTE